jgi:hypothetical protein
MICFCRGVVLSLWKVYVFEIIWLNFYHTVPFQIKTLASGDGILTCQLVEWHAASIPMICLLVVGVVV